MCEESRTQDTQSYWLLAAGLQVQNMQYLKVESRPSFLNSSHFENSLAEHGNT